MNIALKIATTMILIYFAINIYWTIKLYFAVKNNKYKLENNNSLGLYLMGCLFFGTYFLIYARYIDDSEIKNEKKDTRRKN